MRRMKPFDIEKIQTQTVTPLVASRYVQAKLSWIPSVIGRELVLVPGPIGRVTVPIDHRGRVPRRELIEAVIRIKKRKPYAINR